ncbi:MAG: glycosyltransferase family 2 protein, partial [Bacteroidota bacterium]
MKLKPLISIVSPVYRGEKMVDALVERIRSSVFSFTSNFEIILVEDGGPDDSWAKIEENCAKYSEVIGVKLSRNFGQHYAITAGLSQAKGEWVIVMDCDLQDKPEEIPRLYQKAQEGYELVYARRVVRQDSYFKRMGSKLFYQVLGYLTDTKQDSTIANFGIYHQKVVQAILSMKDHIRYFPTMSQWVGFDRAYLDVQHQERDEGKSSYT